MDLSKYYFTETHEWVLIEDEYAYIGITDYAQKELGDIVYVECPEEGDEVEKNEPFGSIEAVKAVEEINSPIDGVVKEVNKDLETMPELINESPYEEGWIIKVKYYDKKGIENLLSEKKYHNLLEDI